MSKQVGGLDVSSPNEAKGTISALIYGNSGVGKTVLAASASVVEQMSPVLILDFEGGVLPLRSFYPDVDVVRAKTWKDMQNIYAEARKGNLEYNTIILDSMTELQKFSMNSIMERVVKEDPERDPDIPSMREYGKNLEQMRRIVRLFRDLPVNTLFTAHAAQETYGKAERTRTKISLTGKLADEIAGFMDLVLYLYVKTKNKEEVRAVLSQQREDIIAKDRTTRLPKVIEAPTMADIYKYCFENVEPPVEAEDELADLVDVKE